MNRDRRFTALTLILGGCAVVLTASFVLAPSGGSQTATRPPAQEVFLSTDSLSADLATIKAQMSPENTPVPTPTRPRNPTATPRPSCTGALSPGAICYGATVTPTLAAVVPPPTPYPTYPGVARETPGAAYLWSDQANKEHHDQTTNP